MVPDDLRFTKEHEWVRLDGDEATVGITQYAADQLGDIVFVELTAVGRTLEQAGEVTGINEALADKPELVNSEPFGEGWMVRVRLADATQVDGLLDAAGYETLVAEG